MKPRVVAGMNKKISGKNYALIASMLFGLFFGADFKLRCLGCGREVMGPRAKFEKMIRQVDRKET